MWQTILEIVNNLLAYITPGQKIYRLKKEKHNLENEMAFLLQQPANEARAKRVLWIKNRLEEIDEIFTDHAID